MKLDEIFEKKKKIDQIALEYRRKEIRTDSYANHRTSHQLNSQSTDKRLAIKFNEQKSGRSTRSILSG